MLSSQEYSSGWARALFSEQVARWGGTSLIARMCHNVLGWDLVRTIFVLDVLIVLSGLVVMGPLNTMYTIIALFVAKKSNRPDYRWSQSQKGSQYYFPSSTTYCGCNY
ncbi:YitT family protein [Virgibacillus halophilus]|uniref:YitT family protein n=1 Tax=Tigheibacillus halophilus TaxID=361280 RepID=A0ABU5C3E4_9BACI|nr:YitT family protein [Virgibacillus halophilus]